MSTVVYVGMDVDKKKIVVAKLGDGRGTEVIERVIANTPSAVKKYFAPLAGEADVMATYEAGCFGFGLYRQLTEMGVACLVAAPGLIPRKPSDRVKTDRRDARTLGLALRSGQLTAVHIPTRHDESVRDYLRMYEDLRSDLRKAKQRVLHFLLRRGISYHSGGNWTRGHKEWLAVIEFKEPIERQTLDLYMAHLLELERKCAEVASVAEQIGEEKRYREKVSRLRAFKGVKTLTALAFVCDIGERSDGYQSTLIRSSHRAAESPSRKMAILKASPRQRSRRLSPGRSVRAICWTALTGRGLRKREMTLSHRHSTTPEGNSRSRVF